MKSELLGPSIKKIRKLRGVRRRRFAKKIGIKSAELKSIELGQNLPSTELIEKMAEQLDMPIPCLKVFGLSAKSSPAMAIFAESIKKLLFSTIKLQEKLKK